MAALLAALERDPAATRRRWLVGAAIAIAFAGVGATGYHEARRHASLVCQGAEARAIGVWDPPRRERVRAAFLATGLPYAENAFSAIANKLDRSFQDWQVMHVEACQATRVRGEQSEEVMQLRMECLDRRREELRALVDVFTQADAAVVQRAVSSGANLSSLDECGNTEALRTVVRPPAGATQGRVAALRTRLAAVKARRLAGRYQDGLALAISAADDARALAYAPVVAEALTERGQLEMRSGKAEASVETLIAAAAAAEAGRYDHQLAYVLTELVYIVAEKLGRYDEATRYDALAQGALARAGSDPKLEVRLDEHQTAILFRQARWDEALTVDNRVLARRKALWGENTSEVGVTLVNLGEIYRNKGDFDRAIDYFQQALTNFQHSYGPEHPQTAMAWNCLGAGLGGKKDWTAAMNAYEKALAIRQRVLGPEHPDVAETLASMGTARQSQGRPDEALALLERGQAIERKTVGPESPAFSNSELNIGSVLLKLGRLDAALEHARHALAIRERLFDPQNPDVAVAAVLVAQVRLARHEGAQAVPLLERSLAVLEHHEAAPQWLIEGRFALARASWDLGRDRAHARALALAARERAGDDHPEIDLWLAKHR
jgi:tetratricopeptide (TPR) repeat protein